MAPRRKAVLYIDSRDESKMHQLGSMVLTQQRGDAAYGAHWSELSAVLILICPLSLLIILTVLPFLVSSLISKSFVLFKLTHSFVPRSKMGGRRGSVSTNGLTSSRKKKK